MKLASILVLCLAVTVHQIRAQPSIFDIISSSANTASSIAERIVGAAGSIAKGVSNTANNAAQGAISAATGISQGVIAAGTGTIANLANIAGELNKAIAGRVKDIQGKIPQVILDRVQSVLKNIQDATRGALQATQVAAEKVQEGVQELTAIQQENINEWANQANNKLANSSEDAQLRGQELIEGFAAQQSEDLQTCTDKIVDELQQLQKKANSTARRFHGPMNQLVEEVGKCSENKPNNARALAGCAADIGKALKPLAAAPVQLGAVKAKIAKAGMANLEKNVCVASVLRKFRHEANRVDKDIDQLVADDKRKADEAAQQEGSVDETDPADEEEAPTDKEQAPQENEDETAPGEDEEEE